MMRKVYITVRNLYMPTNIEMGVPHGEAKSYSERLLI